MKLHSLLVPLVIGAVALAPAVARAEDSTTVRDAYTTFRDAGCDAKTIGSPIVARVFRNVPYAQQGKIFKSPELTYLYEHDGGWYKPAAADADVAEVDRACVRKIDAQEKKLRGRVKLKKPIEQAVTRHAGAVLDMSNLVSPDFKKFHQSERTVDGMRQWSVGFEGGGAALVTITCMVPIADAKAKPPVWSKLECHPLAAG